MCLYTCGDNDCSISHLNKIVCTVTTMITVYVEPSVLALLSEDIRHHFFVEN